MRVIFLILILFSELSFTQDYVVDEVFEPENYEKKEFEVSSDNRIIYSLGLNVKSKESSKLKHLGSNYFDLRYHYNFPLTKRIYLNMGGGYNFNIYNIQENTNFVEFDSLYQEKSKFRFQNITGCLGLRVQTKKSARYFWFFEANFFNDFLTKSAYITVGELNGMNYKTKITNLYFARNHQYGFEVRSGIRNISLFSRCRLSDIFKSDSILNNISFLTFGLQFEFSLFDDL